ncbi:hypothetical protein [Streptomyces spectabilis]|uniref:Uncharacterized protein n=1 Tax=Streptomyces spectabilis TaxID=68270 RepID=A0A7W8B2H3_STRST|nr:hypothetical protein [Streptomyces spectabilis]MBB5109140.1 hypothetical protein [Streptomyces spectabilis]MCI3907690.1 hypothetical protein [Streptomyces spectabilis]MCI3907702.1 hypothetical protein [Streptomyces spectabilis]
METGGWAAHRELVVRCLTEAKTLWQNGEWAVSDAERAAARATGLTTAAAYDYPPLPVRDSDDLFAPPSWLQRACRLAALAGTLRAAADPLPVEGPLPMLLSATADLCDQLRGEVARLEAQLAADAPADGWEAWELDHVSDDLWRMTDGVATVVSRVAQFLGTVLVAD